MKVKFADWSLKRQTSFVLFKGGKRSVFFHLIDHIMQKHKRGSLIKKCAAGCQLVRPVLRNGAAPINKPNKKNMAKFIDDHIVSVASFTASSVRRLSASLRHE